MSNYFIAEISVLTIQFRYPGIRALIVPKNSIKFELLAVNEIETVVAVAFDKKGKLDSDEWVEIKRIAGRMQKLLNGILLSN